MGGGGGGGPCDYCVSPSPFDLDLGTSDFGLWDFRLGLDNCEYCFTVIFSQSVLAGFWSRELLV